MIDPAPLAAEAMAAFGGEARILRMIRNRENIIFEIERDGARAALRLHRPGYQSKAAIRSELDWTAALAARGFLCPNPLEAPSGERVIELASGQLASLVTWIDADPIGENGVPFDGTVAEHCNLMRRIGEIVRQLHDLTDQIDTSGYERPSWDREALLGESPHWGAFWTNPSLAQHEVKFLQNARKNAAQQLLEINDLDTGLIHADLLQENVLQIGNALYLIDFDDSGFGYRLYDLGTALIQHAEHERFNDLSAAICEGYGCESRLMPLFVMLRAMASCGWVISRLPHDDPRQRFYAERTLRCAAAYEASL